MINEEDTIQEKKSDDLEEDFDRDASTEERQTGNKKKDGSDQDTEAAGVDWENKYKRALADYQNLEKRVAEQRRDWMISASRDIVHRLLPVLDTLILAEEHTKDQGVALSIQQFTDVLKTEGVIRIETKGKKFDPTLMEAVGTAEGDNDTVVKETRPGYLLHEKLLRPAQVIVGNGKK